MYGILNKLLNLKGCPLSYFLLQCPNCFNTFTIVEIRFQCTTDKYRH